MKRKVFKKLYTNGSIGGGAADIPFFTQFGTPSNAFSFRDLRGDNPTVVKVKRGNDDAVETFTASQVQAKTPLYTFAAAGGVANAALTIEIVYNQVDGGKNLYTSTKNGSPYLLVASGGIPAVQVINEKPAINIAGSRLILVEQNFTDTVTNSFWVFHPTRNSTYRFFQDTYASPVKYGYDAISGNTDSVLFLEYGSPSLAINGSSVSPSNKAALYTLVNDVKHLQTIENEDLSDWFQMRIGNGDYNGFIGDMITYPATTTIDTSGINANIQDFYGL